VSIPSFKAIFIQFLPRFLGDSSHRRSLGIENKYVTGPETSRTRFADLGERTNNTGVVIIVDTAVHKNTVDTKITSGRVAITDYDPNTSSSEGLALPPEGKILAQTQISTTVSSPSSGDA